MKTWVPAVLFLLCSVTPAYAQTFYVSTTGSDNTGTGTDLNPWATITHALDSVSDQSLILVKPGTYEGRIRLRGTFANGVTVRSQIPYQAVLMHDSTVVTCYYGQGITLEGFEIMHDNDNPGALVIQIQDLIDEPGGNDRVERIRIINNILHDSYNNDILKINNGCRDILVQGNMFYNQEGSDEHIDINSVTGIVVQDNIFFNDFAGSVRPVNNDTSSYIVIKDSNGSSDGITGSQDITIQRNIFFNWQGSTGSNFVLVGEDGNPYFEAQDVYIRNNLMLGNSDHVMRAPFGVKGGKNIFFIHNTICGDLPSYAYAMRLNTEGSNPANENIVLANNIWSDPYGTMGARTPSDTNDFSDTPPSETLSFTLSNNLYWNGSSPIPNDPGEKINFTDDTSGIVADPMLPDQSALTALPRWDAAAGQFKGGYDAISSVFTHMVKQYGTPGHGSPVRDQASLSYQVDDDILGRKRPEGNADIGALEIQALTHAPLMMLLD